MRVLIFLMAVFLIGLSSCSEEDNPVDTTRPPALSPEDSQVIANCYFVQQVAEDYAAAHNGLYPDCILPSMLPGGVYLENPYTQARDLPIEGYALHPGETAYRPSIGRNQQGQWGEIGYMITGYGSDSEILCLKKNFPDSLKVLELQVIENCRLVQAAAEAWAFESGRGFPGGLSDTTSLGNNLFDFLPGGTLLVNPFTGWATEPFSAFAATPGQTGYGPNYWTPGGWSNYVITGFGQFFLLLTLTAW